MPGIFMASLGCVKNLVDAEMTLGETLGDRFTLETDPVTADIILVNTCGFIEDARNEGREVIAEYLGIKERADKPVLVVAMGCWAERDPAGLLREFPALDAVWGLEAPCDLGSALRDLRRGKGRGAMWQGKPAMPKDGARLVVTMPSYAYLKLSDGCDNRCNYCAIPLIRGELRSRRTSSIVEEAKVLADQGIQELVLVAQDTTAYGMDDPGQERNLPGLLERLLDEVDIPRFRLLYAHPAHIDDETISLLLSEPKLCRYVDLPLQHVSDRILAAMGRGYGRERIDEILTRFSAGVTMRTTFITGYPGEKEKDFLEVLDLVERGWFRHVGVFAYSPEPGTPAASAADQVPPEEAARRRNVLMDAQRSVAHAWLDSRIGKFEDILLDGWNDSEWLLGRSVNEAPDADGVVFVRGTGTLKPGRIIEACIKARDDYDLVAEPGSRPTTRRFR